MAAVCPRAAGVTRGLRPRERVGSIRRARSWRRRPRRPRPRPGWCRVRRDAGAAGRRDRPARLRWTPWSRQCPDGVGAKDRRRRSPRSSATSVRTHSATASRWFHAMTSSIARLIGRVIRRTSFNMPSGIPTHARLETPLPEVSRWRRGRERKAALHHYSAGTMTDRLPPTSTASVDDIQIVSLTLPLARAARVHGSHGHCVAGRRRRVQRRRDRRPAARHQRGGVRAGGRSSGRFHSTAVDRVHPSSRPRRGHRGPNRRCRRTPSSTTWPSASSTR